jgi:hypothetical protein
VGKGKKKNVALIRQLLRFVLLAHNGIKKTSKRTYSAGQRGIRVGPGTEMYELHLGMLREKPNKFHSGVSRCSNNSSFQHFCPLMNKFTKNIV